MHIQSLLCTLGLVLSILGGSIQAKVAPQPDALMVLSEGWVCDEKTYTIPFILETSTPASLSIQFDLDCLSPDSLFLYLEGVAWEAEVVLNGLFLDIHLDPFRPWIVPLDSSWLQETGNILEVNLKLGQRYEWYPQEFLGIHRPVMLLSKDQLAKLKEPLMKTVSQADTLAVWAPYFGEQGFLDNELSAARMALPLIREGIRHIYFPFEPSREFQSFCDDLGLIRVTTFPETGHICWLNAYRQEARTINFLPPFWLDESGNRTIHYGCYYALGEVPEVAFDQKNQFVFVLMAMFPFLSLFFVKMLSPSLFAAIKDWLMAPKLHIDMFTSITASNPGLLMILLGLKLLMIVLALCMTFYYIQQANLWDHLNLFKSWSLTNYLFYGDFGVGQLFLRSLLVVLGWFALEQMIIWVASVVFGIKGFLRSMLNLNVMGAYPLIWLMGLPATFILFSDHIGKETMLYIMGVLLLVYMIRQLYISYLGLEKLFAFSSGIKFLYICGFNILPYIIWI